MKKYSYIVFIIFIIAAVLNEFNFHKNSDKNDSAEISIDKNLLNTIIHSQQIQEARKNAQVIEPIDIEDSSYPRSSGNIHLVKVSSPFNTFNKEPSDSTHKSILKYKGKMIIQLNGKVVTSGQSETFRDMLVIDNPKEQTYLVLLGPDSEQHVLMPPRSYIVMNSLKGLEKMIDIAIFEFPSRDPDTLQAKNLYEYYTLDLKNISGYHAVIYNIGGANRYHLSRLEKEK